MVSLALMLSFVPTSTASSAPLETIGSPGAATAVSALSDARKPAKARSGPVRFGVQFHGMWSFYTDAERRTALDRIKASGASWVRLSVSWAMIQPQAGSYDRAWGVPFVDRVIKMARKRGLKVLVTFWRTPAWANGGQSDVTLPDDVDDFARAAGWAAKRWAGVVNHWEIWNEPNLDSYMAGADATAYTRLLCAAYTEVKANNPKARVVFGGTVYSDDDWISQSYRSGAKGCFDVMAIHPSVAPGDASPLAQGTGEVWDFDNIAAVRRVMVANSDRKAVWATEFGWSSHPNTASTEPWNRGVTEAQQATYAVQALQVLNARFPYVRKAFWYNEVNLNTGSVHHDNFGLLTSSFAPKPVYHALRTFLHAGS